MTDQQPPAPVKSEALKTLEWWLKDRKDALVRFNVGGVEWTTPKDQEIKYKDIN